MFKQHRPTWLEINLDNIHKNYLTVSKIVKDKKVIPVVKANAYGHGAIQVVDYFIKKGINFFAVSLLEEALELREKHSDIDILVMGVVTQDDLETIEHSKITFTVSDPLLAKAVTDYNGVLTFHVKVDTGMNRLGFKDIKSLTQFMSSVALQDNKVLEGIYTHFATSDNNYDFFEKQKADFEQVLETIPYKPEMIHASNTSATLKYEDKMPYNTHVRVGIALYGLSLEADVDYLKNTYTLKTKIVQIKYLKPLEYVGYGITYQAKENEIIGILPIGYADGLIRKNQNGYASIRDKRYQLVGRICMDQAFIKIDESIMVDDIVTLMGHELITIDEVAERLETINYEVVCQITYRVPRIYLKEE